MYHCYHNATNASSLTFCARIIYFYFELMLSIFVNKKLFKPSSIVYRVGNDNL